MTAMEGASPKKMTARRTFRRDGNAGDAPSVAMEINPFCAAFLQVPGAFDAAFLQPPALLMSLFLQAGFLGA